MAPFIQMGFPSKVRSNLPMYAAVLSSTRSLRSPAAKTLCETVTLAHGCARPRVSRSRSIRLPALRGALRRRVQVCTAAIQPRA